MDCFKTFTQKNQFKSLRTLKILTLNIDMERGFILGFLHKKPAKSKKKKDFCSRNVKLVKGVAVAVPL